MSDSKQDDFERMRLVATWPKAHPGFWRQMQIGIGTYLFGPSRPDRSADASEFFRAHYTQEPDPLVFDGHTRGYFEQLLPLLQKGRTAPLSNVIDLGCGTALLYEFLKNRGMSVDTYIGLDLAVPTQKLANTSHVYQVDLRSAEAADLLTTPGTLFAVNTLCYLEDLAELPVLRATGTGPGNVLLVLEPWPGYFWDQYFDGIWPVYRTPAALASTLSRIGWSPTSLVEYYLTRILGRFTLRLTYGLAFISGGATGTQNWI